MTKKSISERRRRLSGGIAITLFLLALVIVTYLLGRPMIDLVKDPDNFRAWVDARGIWGRLVFLGMVILQMLLAFIPVEPLELAAGYAFGLLEGTLLCLGGILIGSTLIFLFVRRFGVRAVERFFSREKIASLRFLRDSRRLYPLTFLLMLIPGTPKDLLSYFVPLTNMPLSVWLLISLTARLPSVVSSTCSGGALGDRNYALAAITLAVTALVSLIGFVIYRRIHRHEKSSSK